MDGLTLAAAALAIAVEESRDAALRQAVLERERLAVAAEDRGSFLAQRLYTGSTQVPSAMPPMTWRAAHTRVHNQTLELRDVMDEARRALRRGHADRALALLDAELDRDEPAEDDSSAEEAEDDSSAEKETDQKPEPAHRCVVCGLTRRSVDRMLPTGRWANLPMEQRLVCDDCDAAQ